MSVPHIRSRHSASGWRGSWLVPLSGHWTDAARIHLSHHAALVRVTVTALRGANKPIPTKRRNSHGMRISTNG